MHKRRGDASDGEESDGQPAGAPGPVQRGNSGRYGGRCGGAYAPYGVDGAEQDRAEQRNAERAAELLRGVEQPGR